jgi:hypothetical protein
MISELENRQNLYNNIVTQVKIDKIDNIITHIIVTGSFGKNEPSYFYKNDEIIYKSDIELVFVVKNYKYKKFLLQYKEKYTKLFNIDVSLMIFKDSRYINGYNSNELFPKNKFFSIFSYDFYQNNIVIYGEKLNLSFNREIDKYEAIVIFTNRLAEYFSYYFKNVSDDVLLFWKSKVLISYMEAILIINNLYTSSYSSQLKSFSKLFPENKYLDLFNKAYKYLRQNGAEYSIEDSVLIDLSKDMIEIKKNNNLNKSRINSWIYLIRNIIIIIKNKLYSKITHFNRFNYIFDKLTDGLINNNTLKIKDACNFWLIFNK